MNRRDRAARRELGYAPPIPSIPDPEFTPRIDAQRVTAQFTQPLTRAEIKTRAPRYQTEPNSLFAELPEAQLNLFEGENENAR